MRIGGTGVLGLGGTVPHRALFGVVSLGRVTGCSFGSFWPVSTASHCPCAVERVASALADLPSPMNTMMKNMFVHVFQGWASDVQPNISEHGVLDCHGDPFRPAFGPRAAK